MRSLECFVLVDDFDIFALFSDERARVWVDDVKFLSGNLWHKWQKLESCWVATLFFRSYEQLRMQKF